MDAGHIVTLLSLTITNVVALCVVYVRQKRYNNSNYGVKNGRGDLYKQIGKLQDDMHRETQLLTSDVAELRGMLRVHLKESSNKR
jgi:hypothetical protein